MKTNLKMDMNKNVLSIVAACAIVACLAFSGETPHVCTPETPKEIDVKICSTNAEARSYIISQHYKGWVLKALSPDKYTTVVVTEKY